MKRRQSSSCHGSATHCTATGRPWLPLTAWTQQTHSCQANTPVCCHLLAKPGSSAGAPWTKLLLYQKHVWLCLQLRKIWNYFQRNWRHLRAKTFNFQSNRRNLKATIGGIKGGKKTGHCKKSLVNGSNTVTNSTINSIQSSAASHRTDTSITYLNCGCFLH